MSDLKLDQELLRDLKQVKSELVASLNAVRNEDTDDGRRSGKARLASIGGFRPSEFRQLSSSDARWSRKRAFQILRFLEGLSQLNTTASKGIPQKHLMIELRTRRESKLWIDVRDRLRGALEQLETPANPARARRSPLGSTRPAIATDSPPSTDEGARWRVIEATEFDAPADVGALPAEYVGGRARIPWWIAAHVAIQRTSSISDLDTLLKNSPIVVVHGPTGQGKSTLLRQYARHWLNRGVVVEFDHANALADRSLANLVVGATQEVLMVADDLDGDILSISNGLLRKLRYGGASIVIASQSRRRFAHLTTLPHQMVRQYPLPNPSGGERMAMADLVAATSEIADAANAVRVRDLFNAALDDYPSGGLWPAMFQATHGEGLAERMQRLVQDIARDEARLHALAAITFANAMRDSAPDNHTLTFARKHINSRLVSTLTRNLDLKPDQSARATLALSAVHSWFDREVLGDRLEASSKDPPVDLRHPAVSNVLHANLFDPAKEGAAHFDERAFYVPYAFALADPQACRPADRATRAADILRLMYALDRQIRRKQSRGLQLDGFLKGGKHDLSLFDNMADAALSADPSNQEEARALIWKAAVTAKRSDPNHEAVADYLGRALTAMQQANPPGDISANIGIILAKLDKTFVDPRDGAVRDSVYYMSTLIPGLRPPGRVTPPPS